MIWRSARTFVVAALCCSMISQAHALVIVFDPNQIEALSLPAYSGIENDELKSKIDGGLTFTPLADGDGMYGKFQPDLTSDLEGDFIFQQSLGNFARANGYQEFRWLQYVSRFPGLLCVNPFVSGRFIDPPKGGCSTPELIADDEDFYWDTGDPESGMFDPGYTIGENTLLDEQGELILGISFIDRPSNVFAIPIINEMEFYTYLVGVREDRTYDILSEPFVWRSDRRPEIDIDVLQNAFLSRNIEPTIGSGGVTQYGVESLADIDDAQRQALIRSGATNVPSSQPAPIPVPSSYVLLMTAIVLFSLISIPNRNEKRQKSSLSKGMTKI